MNTPVRVAVTGAAGQIAYSLLFRLAAGDVFGSETPVELRLVEIESAMPALEGVAMELDDCAFPLLTGMELTTDLASGFDGVNWALLIGSVPRKAGMERRDLLGVNGSIFKPQGRALAEHAASDVRILVVGNPCNTNALIARENAREIPDERWFSMTRLDQNRARTQLAQRAGVPVTEVRTIAIWGNHSSTQVPDYWHATIGGLPAREVIKDETWFDETFIPTVQQRGAAIIKARGASSAASAANAVIDSVRSVVTPTPADDWDALAVPSDGSYGIPSGIFFGFPVRSDGTRVSIVGGLDLPLELARRLDATRDELLAERDEVLDLLG